METFDDQVNIKIINLIYGNFIVFSYKLNAEQNKECIIAASLFKYSLVTNRRIGSLKTIDNTV